MAYPDAPEFQTSGAGGYSPDRFYCQSRNGPQGERRWISLGRQTFPAEMIARVEDLIHQRRFPAYHTIGDFVRDAVVHHLYSRLSELRDPTWHRQRDVYAMLFEIERLELEGSALESAYDRFNNLLRDERDAKKRERIKHNLREFVDELESDYWRARFTDLLR